MSTAAAAMGWEVRRVRGRRAVRGAEDAGRWGVVYLPTGQWVAFGSEARCRRMAAHLTVTEAVLGRTAPGATGGAPRR